MEKVIKILAISGSLRQKSSNTALLKAMIELAPENMKFTNYGGLGNLPHFNPDIDVDDGPSPVGGLISASPTPMGGDKAHTSLLLTLKMINAVIVEGGTMMIPHITLKLNKEGVITDSETKQKLLSVLWALEKACH